MPSGPRKPSRRPRVPAKPNQQRSPRKRPPRTDPAKRSRLADDVEHLAIDAITGNLPAAAVDGVKTIIDSVTLETKSDGRGQPRADLGRQRNSGPKVLAVEAAANNRLAHSSNGNPGRRRRNALALPPGPVKRAVRAVLGRRRRKPGVRKSPQGKTSSRIIAAQLGATRAPQSTNRRRRLRFVQSTDDSLTLEGHDFMATVTMTTTMSPGDRVLVAEVHPQAIVGASRLGRISSAFETYLYEKYHATVISTADTGIRGNYTLHFDKDSGDSLIPMTGGGYMAKEQAVAHNGIISKSFENAELSMPLHNQQKEYYVQENGSDSRLTKQARFYILCSTTPSDNFDMDVWINWRCRLRLPALDGPSEGPAGAVQFLLFDYVSAMTAANPLGQAAPTSATNVVRPGIGFGWNGTDSYVYCKVGYSTMSEFNIQMEFDASTVGSPTGGYSNNLTAPMAQSVGFDAGAGSARVLTSRVVRYNGTPTVVTITGGYYYDGAKWVPESPVTNLNVHWYFLIHLSAFTSPSIAAVQLTEISSWLGSNRSRVFTTPRDSREEKSAEPRDEKTRVEPVERKVFKTVTVSDEEFEVTPRPKRSFK